MYDEFDQAWTSRDKLIAAGIPAGNLAIFGEGRAGSPADHENAQDGFLSALKGFIFADEDHTTFVEGLKRGGVLLSVRVPEAELDMVCRILKETRPVDLDARLDEWHRSGWSDYDPSRKLDEQARPREPRDPWRVGSPQAR
jgi:hypothetical protein